MPAHPRIVTVAAEAAAACATALLLAGALQPGPPARFPAHWIVEPSEPVVPVFDAALARGRGRIALLGGFTKALEATKVVQIHDDAHGWLPVAAQMLEARARHTATSLGDGRWLVVGGAQGTIGGELKMLDSCEVLDPFSAGSVAIDPVDEPLVGHSAHRLVNGVIAVIGGDACRLFDPAVMKWTARITLAQRRVNHASLLIEGGDLLIIGGDDAGTIERVDLPDSFSEPRATAPPPSQGGGQGVSHSHLNANGSTHPSPLPGREESQTPPIDQSILDAITSTIIADIPGGGFSHPAAVELADGRIWIAGGLDDSGTSMRDTWFVDLRDGATSPGDALPFEGGAEGIEAFRTGGYAILVGGEMHDGKGSRTPATHALMLELRTNRLWLLPDIPAIPPGPGQFALTASRRHWYLDEQGRVCAEGGYRFVSKEESERTGQPAGIHILKERITLVLGKVPVLID
jgi:hypothetical protein